MSGSEGGKVQWNGLRNVKDKELFNDVESIRRMYINLRNSRFIEHSSDWQAGKPTDTGFIVTGSSVVVQLAIYPEVVGSIPAPFYIFINLQIIWAPELTMIITCIRTNSIRGMIFLNVFKFELKFKFLENVGMLRWNKHFLSNITMQKLRFCICPKFGQDVQI